MTEFGMSMQETLALIVVVLYLLPIASRAWLVVRRQEAEGWWDADLSSVGFLPEASTHPEARVLVMSARVFGLKGILFSHSWIVLKEENAPTWRRYDVVGWSNRGATNGGLPDGRWFNSSPVVDRWLPDGRWFGNDPTLIAEVKGDKAKALIRKIEATIDRYESDHGRYRPWPGPNSNTFVAY